MPKAGLREVAARAGVSVRTVSNVVNAFPHVAPETRARVQRAIDELGYRPNSAARSLRLGRSETISLVVPEIESPYFAELASTVVRRAEQRGWTVHIDQTDGRPDRERSMLAGPHGREVDGVLFSPWALTPADLDRRTSATPVVVLGERSDLTTVDRVAVDNVAAAAEATEHLLGLGRRHIAAVGLQPHLINQTAVQRRDGYRAALTAAGVPLDDGLELEVQRLHRGDGAQAVRRLLDAGPDVDALFCFTDQLALGAIRELSSRGVRVPDDVAVVGFDDIEDGRFAVPTLTTVSPDKTGIAELSLRCLAERMADPDLPPRDLQAAHRLVVRESTAVRGEGRGQGHTGTHAQ